MFRYCPAGLAPIRPVTYRADAATIGIIWRHRATLTILPERDPFKEQPHIFKRKRLIRA
jgi:hypothetical protein